MLDHIRRKITAVFISLVIRDNQKPCDSRRLFDYQVTLDKPKMRPGSHCSKERSDPDNQLYIPHTNHYSEKIETISSRFHIE